MVDFIDANVLKLSAHQIGNKTNGDRLNTSKSELDISDEEIKIKLSKFFLDPFNSTEYYTFTSTTDDHTLNPVYQLVREMFESLESFHENSINIAKHLYEVSSHPQIKIGDLFVSYFTHVNLDNQIMDVIGIFKSENKTNFIKLNTENTDEFEINLESGINLEKLDKGCLIYNIDAETGFKISIIDKTSKSFEAQYWKDLFLKVKPIHNNFQNTKNFLEIAKHYVTDQIADEFELSKADQIVYLNRSIDYFKSNEEFDKGEFEKQVFEDPQVIKSFRKFDNNFREQFNLEVEDNFDISTEVVKKQGRIFKSVLKLDRNFHVYIHGDTKLIEKGVEIDGRKYYKIYYQEEQ